MTTRVCLDQAVRDLRKECGWAFEAMLHGLRQNFAPDDLQEFFPMTVAKVLERYRTRRAIKRGKAKRYT